MNVLIACEESQRVCKEFRKKGYNAFSADIQECSGKHKEWHIKGDVIPLINGYCKFKTQDGVIHTVDKEWDLLIGFPPCTYLTKAGALLLFNNNSTIKDYERYKKGLIAKEFFMQLWNCSAKRIALENPTPMKIFNLPKETQVIQPYYFGHKYTKRTLLWLKHLPLLNPTNIVDYDVSWCLKNSYQKTRSKTFVGIAEAMANQWDYMNRPLKYQRQITFF